MAGGSMRAAQVRAPWEARTIEVPAPEPAPGAVLVRLEGCGVCGSNLPVWQGMPWFEYPFGAGAPGHEGWGRVEAVGRDVVGVTEGQRVAVLSQHAFAEYDVAPVGDVIPLPPELDGQPFPGEALACGVNVFRRSGIRAGDTVAVIGVGFLGSIVVALAARDGVRAAVELVASGAIDPSPLYTHRYPLEDLGTALHDLAHRPEGFVKALVLP